MSRSQKRPGIIDRIVKNREKDDDYYVDRPCFEPQENPIGCFEMLVEDALIVNCIMRKTIGACINGDMSFITYEALAEKVIDKYSEIYMTGSYSREATLEYVKSEIEKCKEMSVDRKYELLKFFYDWCGYEFAFEGN